MREEVLTEEITRILSPFQLNQTTANAMIAELDSEKVQDAKSAAPLISERRIQIAKIKTRIDRLLELRLDGAIDNATYVKRKAELMSQDKTLREQISSLTKGEKPWLEPLRNWISAAQNIDNIKETGSLGERVGLVRKIFGSNLLLDGKKARGLAVKPWAFLADNELSHDVVGTLDAARTFFAQSHVPPQCCLNVYQRNQPL